MIPPPAAYLKLPYNTAAKYEGKHPGSRALVISNGHSTSHIVDKKAVLKNYFDCIIVVNRGFEFFDDVADYHVVCEKISPTSMNRLYMTLNAGNYRTDMPRFFNWKGIQHYDSRYNVHKLVRNYFDGKPNIRRYSNGTTEGLLIGYPSSNNMALGSVTLSSMHLASILGAKEIYLIGADMMFKDNSDHFYQDRAYRDGQKQTKAKNLNHVVSVEHRGKTYQTTDYFRDSATCIDKFIKDSFSKELQVFDFSDGLITAATPLDPVEFFK